MFRQWMAVLLWAVAGAVSAQMPERVVDIPTRPGVVQRMLVLAPPEPRAAVILMAGGHGGLQIQPDGSLLWGAGNFLVRTRQQFAAQGLLVAVVDAPSDRQSQPYLQGFRQRAEHVADLRAVMAWLRAQAPVPVWLVGTSRGTQSAAWVATQLASMPGAGPDGLVLTSTILSDNKSRAVPTMALDELRIPVLVVHHQLDACPLCAYSSLPSLMGKLRQAPRKQLLNFQGGKSEGDPCEAFAYHGYNGIEPEVVKAIADWVLVRP